MHQNASFNRINNMNKDNNLKKLFSNLELFEPKNELYENILENIEIKQKVILSRRRFFIFATLFLLSLISLIPAIKMLVNDFTNSGFIQFFSLIFSDSQIILNYWQSFVLTLLESLPIISTVIFLGILFVMLESIRFISKDIKFVFLHN